MAKLFLLVLLIFVPVDHTLALNCYATDVQAFEATQKISHDLRNCEGYISDMRDKFNIAEIGGNDPVRCYSVNVNTDAPSNEFVIKGCVPNGHCESLVKPIIQSEAKKRSVSIKDMKCVECVDNECN